MDTAAIAEYRCSCIQWDVVDLLKNGKTEIGARIHGGYRYRGSRKI